MIRIPLCVIILAGMMFTSSGAIAGTDRTAVIDQFDGITVIGLNPPEGAIYDFPIINPRDGVAKIVEALALIGKKSPYSQSQINDLKRAGAVTIVYDPHFPDRLTNISSILAAIFMPNYGAVNGSSADEKNFLVVVSRYGIKWPLKELTPVLVHELVGHGVQHLEDRLETMRNIDLECEAWLYTEMAHQELGMANFTEERIGIRKNIKLQCYDFFSHLQTNDPVGYEVWSVLDPDIPQMLLHFNGYMNELRRTGVMGKTLQNAANYTNQVREELFQDGAPEAQFMMAEVFLNGQGVKQDSTEALRWHKRAAENGHVEAQRIVGDFYVEAGPDRDLSLAASWYQKSATQGNPEAQYKYAQFFEKGSGGQQKSVADSLKWYLSAAKQGHAKAQFQLGVALETGRGVGKDLSAAAKWYEASALQDYDPAQYKLGKFYDDGSGVAQDYGEALRWYEKAALKVSLANYRLGLLYENGHGVAQNYHEAARHYRLAIDQGSKTAGNRLGKLQKAHPEVMP